MKEKQIEEKSYRTVYVAVDGREFDDKNACLKYDKSFACVMKSYLNDMAIRPSSTEEDLFYAGNSDTEVFVVIPKNKEDILRIKQVAIGFGTPEDRVNTWINESDINSVILVTIGCDNDWVYISRLNNILKNIVGEKYKLAPTIN